ncbi:MAG: PEP-CTERM/exosortase system-associated acyltransferase [Gammaproteobacteria bacterium]|nr:PEP-CTERM/exosortase system-associated acyltransferase [Gammaproteobacteria bacterium]
MEAAQKKEKTSNTLTDLFSSFNDDFIFSIALTETEKNRIYKLRHEVYCQEIGYHPAQLTDKKTESDIHDSHSIHCLIEHRRSRLAAGCLRLVLPAPYGEGKMKRLPLQDFGEHTLPHEVLHPAKLPYESICEISRFAIARTFRHKAINHETLTPSAFDYQFTAQERKTFPLIVIALFLATYSLVGLMKKRHVFAMMEPRLPRLLSMSGFKFTKVGESIEMHGKRNAFYIDHSKAEKEMHEELMPFYLHIRKILEPQLEELLTKKVAAL